MTSHGATTRPTINQKEKKKKTLSVLTWLEPVTATIYNLISSRAQKQQPQPRRHFIKGCRRQLKIRKNQGSRELEIWFASPYRTRSKSHNPIFKNFAGLFPTNSWTTSSEDITTAVPNSAPELDSSTAQRKWWEKAAQRATTQAQIPFNFEERSRQRPIYSDDRKFN